MTKDFLKGVVAAVIAFIIFALLLEYFPSEYGKQLRKRAERSLELQEKDLLLQQEILENLRKRP